MPRKKSAQEPSKIDFIRSIPLTVPVDEVLAKAQEAGIKLTKGYVQTTRSGMRKSERQRKTEAQQTLSLVGNGTLETAFVRAALHDLGLKKARQLLDETEQRLLHAVGER